MNTSLLEYKLNSKIAIIGLGYVGLPLALSLKKFDVVGFDTNLSRINELCLFRD